MLEIHRKKKINFPTEDKINIDKKIMRTLRDNLKPNIFSKYPNAPRINTKMKIINVNLFTNSRQLLNINLKHNKLLYHSE